VAIGRVAGDVRLTDVRKHRAAHHSRNRQRNHRTSLDDL
jgi:hypothetical protein